ncbi:MAG: Rrf2 family transcriptional regulator [Bacilli bacterium]|jgi:Rrf2 family protein|nr:Rrf2 family transcriptional regulator [Bacilli bacterium]
MIITKETDYALRIISALASGKIMSTHEICSQEFLPVQFTYNIIRKLNKAGYIKITRGRYGGNKLNIDLYQTSLLDLLKVMDENFNICACVEYGFECKRKEKNKMCITHDYLMDIQRSLLKQFADCSLEKLLFGND